MRRAVGDSRIEVDDVIKVVVSGKTKPQTYIVERDMVYFDADGLAHIIKAGTTLSIPVLDEGEPLNVAYVETPG